MPDFDARRVEQASGWRVEHHELLGSTNDEAARLSAAGAGPRSVVVARAQRAGRGREGRAFESPPGGLYASLLVSAAPVDLPGPVVAATALAVAEAVEDATGLVCGIKWPNDLWIEGRKVGGILLEGAPGGAGGVVVGVGLNVQSVPPALGDLARRRFTALALESSRPVEREALLIALLARVDQRLSDLRAPASRRSVAAAWRERLTLRGQRVTWREGLVSHAGVFLDADLATGLCVLDDVGAHRSLRSETVVDLRPA